MNKHNIKYYVFSLGICLLIFDNIISNNSEKDHMVEVKDNHFVATHDVKGLLWNLKIYFFYQI